MMRPSCSVIEQKRAAAEAAAHDRDREADHLVGRDLRVAVATGAARARTAARRRASISARRQRDRRRVEPDVAVAVALHQRARVAGIRLQVQDARGVRVQHRIARDLLEARHADHACARDRRCARALERTSARRLRAPRRARRRGLRGSSIAYGSGADRRGPGASSVRRVDLGPAVGRAARTNAVPRRSVIVATASPAARRCAISTIARSPLP